MSSDSQARFSSSTKVRIRKRYKNRCAVCLQKLTSAGSQCAHLLDASKSGARQFDIAVALGIIPRDYKRSSVENGMVLCPTCHLAFFTSAHVVLSPAPQILQYVVDYLWATDLADRKPLHHIFRLLESRRHADLFPNPDSVLPFLGLYTLIILLPDELDQLQIISHHLPALSILDNTNKFVPAPANTLPDAPGVARIFDALDVALTGTIAASSQTQTQTQSSSSSSSGHGYRIPLSPHHTEFAHTRYWRLPVRPEVVLMMLLERVRHVADPAACEEINHARVIGGILMINKAGVEIVPRPSAAAPTTTTTTSKSTRRRPEAPADDEPPRRVTRRTTQNEKKRKKEADDDAGLDKGKTRRTRMATRASTSNPGPRPKKTKRLKI